MTPTYISVRDRHVCPLQAVVGIQPEDSKLEQNKTAVRTQLKISRH